MKLYAVHEEAGDRRLIDRVDTLEQAAKLVQTLTEEDDGWPEGCEAYVMEQGRSWVLAEDGKTWLELP